MVHHLSRMTDKERRHVCTGDEQRKSPVDKVGIHGDLWSEVRNIHSRHIYLILTQPALGSDTFMRNTKEDAVQLHAQIRSIVTQEKEEDWCAFLPAPTPPAGCTEAAQHRRSQPGGTDTLPRSD